MSTEILHRIQFGLTASFHFLFPPMSLGVGLILIILSFVGGFARDIQQQPESRLSPAAGD